MLEVRPGPGYYTLSVARWPGAPGTLHIVDVQRRMREYTLQPAGERSQPDVAANIELTHDLATR